MRNERRRAKSCLPMVGAGVVEAPTFTLGSVGALDGSVTLTGALGATELGPAVFAGATSAVAAFGAEAFGTAVLAPLTTTAGGVWRSVLPSLRACTPRSNQTPTAAQTLARTTTVNARNTNADRIELSRATNADRASNPFGAGCTRSQISG